MNWLHVLWQWNCCKLATTHSMSTINKAMGQTLACKYSPFHDQLPFHWNVPNFVPNFGNSLRSSKLQNEIDKQVFKQRFWLAIR